MKDTKNVVNEITNSRTLSRVNIGKKKNLSIDSIQKVDSLAEYNGKKAFAIKVLVHSR